MTSVSGASELLITVDVPDEPLIRHDNHTGVVATRADQDGNGRRMLARRKGGSADAQAERARLVRELHDGILQALSGATLQLEGIAGLIDSQPWVAKQRLRKIKRVLTEEQRELRKWVDDVRPAAAYARPPVVDPATTLHRLCRRAMEEYGIEVELRVPDAAALPLALGEHVCRIVQEGLANVGRHALAKSAQVDVDCDAAGVRIVILDDGIGFPFQGSFGLAELVRDDIGPRSLKERVASLNGGLTLTSQLSGSRLEINLSNPRM